MTHLRRAHGLSIVCYAMTVALGGCTKAPPIDFATSTEIHPEIWPASRSGVARDPAIEQRVSALLARMTVEDKVGQIIQADVASVTAQDVRQYRLGSILNGGNSGPYNNDRALAPLWLQAADEFYDAAMDAPEGRPAIPILWGSDAVHGNSNIIGATIFPHNIGLGAMRNPALMRRIGEITAIELRVIGGDWTFAPTIAVVRDDRWGRTYEGYSEEPSIVRDYASAIVLGLQDEPTSENFLRGPHVIATAKHFLGDGGTDAGRDAGNNTHDELALRDLFAPGYSAAIAAGVQSVMASFNSWRGQPLHGHRTLLTEVLVSRMGFDGFVVGDWNGHSLVPGCTANSCAASLLAGVDMYMAPDSWRALYENTLAQARSGVIPIERLDEAVARVLRVKIRAGLFEAGRPSSRPFAGQWHLLGAPAHRAVARQAARESLVLLKNNGGVLPLSPRARVLIAGDGADNLQKQTGGWTISWQGTGNVRADFPNAETFFEGIRDHVQTADGSVELAIDGRYTQRPDVAIVVFGEEPYAEGFGDRPHLDFVPEEPLQLLRRLRADNIPVVAVFLSGRPMYVSPEINAADAFVAAWLPGSEGGALADVLFTDADGNVRHDFKGRLSFSWPRAPDHTSLNVGDADYDPLFPFDYGLRYGDSTSIGELEEISFTPPPTVVSPRAPLISGGSAREPWSLTLVDAANVATPVAATAASAAIDGLTLKRLDRERQEDALQAQWSGTAAASIVLEGPLTDWTQHADASGLAVDLRVDALPGSNVVLALGSNTQRARLDLGEFLRSAPKQQWTRLSVPLHCFREAGADISAVRVPLAISTDGALTLALSAARLTPSDGATRCPPRARDPG